MKPTVIFLQDLTLLLISFATSVLVLIIGFDYNPFTDDFRTQVGTHTYYSGSIYFFPIFTLLTFLLFFIRQVASRSTSNISNTIAFLSGAIFIITIAFLNHFLKPFSRADAFALPGNRPGTELHKKEDIVDGTKEISTMINLGMSLQVLVGIALTYLLYRWIKPRFNR